MSHQRMISALFSLVLMASLSAVGHTQSVSVDSGFRPPDGTDDPTYTPQAQSLTQDSTSIPIALRIILPQVTNSEQATWTEQRKKQPSQIGFGREIPVAYQDDLAPRLTWDTLSDGSLVSALSVTSPGASALRVAVYASLGSGAELRFFSLADSAQHFEPLTEQDFASQANELPVDPPTQYDFTPQTGELLTADESSVQDLPVWSPVIDGETVGIEITLPSSAALSTFSLSVDQVSHIPQSISRSIREPYYEPQHLSGIGRAECSHVDVQCRDVDSEATMTAKMIYTKGSNSFLCTGVLMHDLDDSSFIPYFLTAYHCIATQAAAQTLVTYWDFERASCGGPAPTTVTQLTGGADLLISHPESDSSLLRLRRDPPSGPNGRWYAGWTAATLNHPTSVYGVHHPAGDIKKYSAGTTARHIKILLSDEEGGYLQEVEGVDVRWSQGTIQSGSSGSGLFDTSGRLRGVLSGSPPNETCPTTSAYGRFDRFFPHAAPWLTADAQPTGDDHGDTGDQATSVALGSSTQGRLERQGDRDYFRVSLSGPGTLTVYTTGATDTYGHLWGNGQWLDENDDGGADFNFRIARSVFAGTYYILVRGYNDRSTGRYTLAVRFTPKGGVSSPGDDHGDTGDQATSVALGSSTRGHLERQGDRDYFRVSLSGPGTLTVYTTGATDTYGHLWGNGQWLEENDDGGADFNFRIEWAASAGTYYILVRGYDDRSTGRYTLAVRFTPKGDSGGGGSLNDLLGTWRFTYTIISTFTDTYRLSQVDTSTGTSLIVGTDQYGDPVVGGRIQDISPGNTLPYEFALLDPSITICRFFLFDKTGTYRVEGVFILVDVRNGECGEGISNPHPMTGVRTSRATSGVQEQSPPQDTVLEQLSAELQSVEETMTLGLSSPDEADSAAIRDIIDTLSPALD